MFLLDFLGAHHFVESSKTENWFEDALSLDVYAGSNCPQVKELTDDLFKDVSKRMRIHKKARSKETLKMILLNLWVSYHCDRPVKYSRNPNNYSHSRRYGKLHFKYNRVIPIIDTLEDMGLLSQAKGFYDREKNIKRQTRIYATDELIKIFNNAIIGDFDVIERIPRREIIELKDENKRLIDYKDNEATVGMRRNLHVYNQFIKKQSVNIEIQDNISVSLKFLKDLRLNLLKGMVGINLIKLIEPSRLRIMNSIDNNKSLHSNINSKYNSSSTTKYHNNITHSIGYHTITTMTNKVLDLVNNNSTLLSINEQFKLCDFGIRILDFQLKYELLHRVFNHGSFDCCGRFFGASHIGLPKEIRKNHIAMNGSRTVELDFSAMHIRMLYHLEGIPYKDDPYNDLCGSDEERKIFKLSQLIAINAFNEMKAIMAIRNEFRKKGIKYDLSNKSIGKLLTRFKQIHQPIAKYIHTGKGLDLQNLDSKITEIILMDLMKEGITVLPVHDSYIVEKGYEGLLAEKMLEAYEKVMDGFSPVIG